MQPSIYIGVWLVCATLVVVAMCALSFLHPDGTRQWPWLLRLLLVLFAPVSVAVGLLICIPPIRWLGYMVYNALGPTKRR